MESEKKEESTGDGTPILPVDGEIVKGDFDDIELVIDPNNPNPTTTPGHYGTKLVDVGGCGGLS